MARYRLTEIAFIGNDVHQVDTEIGDGTSVPFSGIPGPHMEPLDDDARKRFADAKKQAGTEGRSFDLNVMNSVPVERMDNRNL